MTCGPVEVVSVVCDGDAEGWLVVGVVGAREPASVMIVPVGAVDPEIVGGGGVDTEESDGLLGEPAVGPGLAAAPPVFGDAPPSPVAQARPGAAATAIPTPNAIASAPTRPM